MKKHQIPLVAVMLMIGTCLQAQLLVNLQLLPEGISRKTQLWNMTLVNNYSTSIDIKINLVMSELSTNQPVLTADTRYINVMPGVKQIIMNDLLPVSYNVLNTAYLVDQTPDGYLPIGKFKVCYAFIASGEASHLAEECNVIEVEPLSPPQLMSPFNSEEIETANPVLTWVAPMPLTLFSNLTYDLSLVEVLENQTTSDAIQKNFPLLIQREIRSMMLPYPVSAPQLVTGKKYAWQVHVKNNGSPVAATEIWSFTIKQPAVPASPAMYGSGFIKLKKAGETPYSVSQGIIRFEYNNEANDSTVQLRIADLSGTTTAIRTSTITIPVKYGQNFLEIDLRKELELADNHVYLMELANSRNERWNLKFQFIKTK